MIDAMPHIVPIVDRVPNIDGLILATGMSGHGFGIGPGFGTDPPANSARYQRRGTGGAPDSLTVRLCLT